MEPRNKCEVLAGKINKILSNGITLDSEVIHYIDSTFSHPTSSELETILQDETNCEKESLMELLQFTEETMQFQLEALLEDLQNQAAHEKALLDDLIKGS